MAVDTLDIDHVCQAAKAVLDVVEGIGIVESQPGEVATWVKRRREGQAFWQLDIVSTDRRGAGVGPIAFEVPVLELEGWMPFSARAHFNSYPVWRALLKRVQDQLLHYPTLANDVRVEGLKGFNPPRLRVQDRVVFEGGGNTPALLCHHAIIEISGERFFRYPLFTSL